MPRSRVTSLLLPLAALFLAACPPGGAATGEDELTEAATRIVPVATAIATSGVVTDPVEGTGTVAPYREVIVSSEGSGRVVAIEARLGDRLEKGDALARLDVEVPRAQLDQAKANLKSAEAMLELAEDGFARAESLMSSSATSRAAHLKARIDLDGARAQVDGAAAAVALAEAALRKTTLRAPWDCVVSSVQLEVGALVAPGQPAFKVVEIDRVKVGLGIPTRQVETIRAGQPARVHVVSLGDTRFDGHLAHLGPEPDPVTRTYPAEVVVDNTDGRLRPGMIGRVEVIVGERDGAVLVPDTAVVDAVSPVLFVLDGDVARERAVVLGRSLGDRVEVRSGLAAGEEVVTLGRQHLSDGTRVERYELGSEPEASPASTDR